MNTGVSTIYSRTRDQPRSHSSTDASVVWKAGLTRITIRVTPKGGVEVTAPEHTPRAEIEALLARKRKWIDTKLTRQRRFAHLLDPTERLLYFGTEYRVDWVRDGDAEPAVDRSAGTLKFSTDCGQRSEMTIRRFIEGESASLRSLTLELAATHALEIRRVTIRNQATRWGSSSSAGTISLNWRLVMAPASVSRYLVLHELAHQRQMNHSRAFWGLVGRWCPEFESHDRWLKDHAFLLSLLR